MNKVLILSAVITTALSVQAQEKLTPKQWFDNGQNTVINNGSKLNSTKRAKNVILFIGDGMGISTVTAARILDGQNKGKFGEENMLSFDKLDNVALSKTYSTNFQTPDSAGTMTAMMTGVKTGSGMISVNGNTKYGDCESSKDNHVETFLEQMKKQGKVTGVISTARITHATPAATFAHTPKRSWEDDKDMPEEALTAGCKDIASQLIDSKNVNIAMGGGRRSFLPKEVNDPEDTSRTGERQDGRNLTTEWIDMGDNYHYVWDKKGFDELPVTANTNVLGLFNRSHLEYEADRSEDVAGEPSLTEMTKKSIDILKQNDKGFFLMVESGRIDHGHHASNAYRALTDTIEFSKAVQTAMDNVNLDETLIIVTADHSHVFTIAGYPMRGNPILGKVQQMGKDGKPVLAKDALGLPYTTLGYTNGPGYTGENDAQEEGPKSYDKYPRKYMKGITAGRPDLTEVDTTVKSYLQEVTVPMWSETHAGEDVGIYSQGPFSHLLNGVVEQNVIYHVMNAAINTDIVTKGNITDVSGWWYDVNNPGLGFNVFSGISNGKEILTMAYYGYENGQPLWLASDVYTGKVKKGQEINVGKVFQPTPNAQGTLTTAPKVGTNGTKAWGTATLQFNSCTSGKAMLKSNSGKEVTIPLFKLAGNNCAE